MDDKITTNDSDWIWSYSIGDDTIGVGTPTNSTCHSGYYEYTFSGNPDGTMKLEKNPYDITDTNGNKWTVTQHPDETLTVNKKDNSMNEKTNHFWKYNEDKILKDVEDYVTSTYGSHYCGTNQAYKDIQTIDLMAAKDLASSFCQANILKYGSRYGSKDGRSKRDLLKVIHYAMLLLHFDGHYTRQNNGISEFR